MSIPAQIGRFIRSHSVLATTIVLVAVSGTVIAGNVSRRNALKAPSTDNTKRVTLVEAVSFRNNSGIVSADGIVESALQADIKSQVSAPIATIRVAVGDRVTAGQIIAELQNADIRAQLEQARTSSAVSVGQNQTGSVATDSARRGAVDTIRNSYIKGDTAIHSNLEQFLYTPSGNAPTLSSMIADRELADDIRDSYLVLPNLFLDWKKSVDSLSSTSNISTIRQSITLSQSNLDRIRTLLDDVSEALNDADQNTTPTLAATINSWKATVAADRSAINAAISSLTQTETSLLDAESISAGAQAGVKALEAQLAKTIIRSPISGVVATVPLRQGELASPGGLIATVVGGGGLQVKAFASGEDFTRLKKNARATIQGSITGVVSRIAPSVDPVSKKVELGITITDKNTAGLIVGQNVRIAIEAQASRSPAIGENIYLLPMQNIKIEPGEAFVFTIDGESKLVKNPVILGEIRGDFVEVKSGLTDDMKIVSPVYELAEGETVVAE